VKFPKYSEYKASQSEWFDRIPAHWKALPCRALVRARDERNEGIKSTEYLSVMANVGVLRYEDKGDVGNKKPEDLSKCKMVRVGDLVINSMNFGIGSYGISAYDGICSPVYIVLESLVEKIENRFAYRIFQNPVFQSFAQSFGNGILEHRCAINWDILKGITVPVPPRLEQLAILEFLDQETSKIDALITEQQRLIELLKEKRRAVISHAVTKGLNPDVRMKPSGVEWLGEVPEHWQVLKGGLLGTLFGSEPIPEEAISEEGDVAFVKVSSMSASGFEIDSWNWFVDSTHARKYEPRSDFLVFPKRGAAIFLNKVNIVTRPSVLDPNLMGWKINSRAIPKFIAYALRSRRLEEIADVSTVPQINNKHIAPQKFGVPPLEEQVEIVRYLDQQLLQMDSLVEDVELGIGLLQERRTALISAAVTGKIDVRNYASTQKDAA